MAEPQIVHRGILHLPHRRMKEWLDVNDIGKAIMREPKEDKRARSIH